MSEGFYDAWDDAKAQAIIDENKNRPGALMPILTALWHKFGYINTEIVPRLAKTLNLSRAEVHGVVTFYHDFRTEPPGKHVIRLCRAEACQSMNGRDLESHIKSRLNVGGHETTKDGTFTLEPVYCLGNCACAPAVMIDEDLHGRVTPERFDRLIAETRKSGPAKGDIQ